MLYIRIIITSALIMAKRVSHLFLYLRFILIAQLKIRLPLSTGTVNRFTAFISFHFILCCFQFALSFFLFSSHSFYFFTRCSLLYFAYQAHSNVAKHTHHHINRDREREREKKRKEKRKSRVRKAWTNCLRMCLCPASNPCCCCHKKEADGSNPKPKQLQSSTYDHVIPFLLFWKIFNFNLIALKFEILIYVICIYMYAKAGSQNLYALANN